MLIQNPEMHYQASQVLNQLRMFIAEHQLPVTVLVAQPSLTQSWVGRILTGRGLLRPGLILQPVSAQPTTNTPPCARPKLVI